MLRMDQVHVIRHKVLVEGRSIRSVAREMGVGRNTIKKYLTLSEMVAPRIEQILTEWRECTTAKQHITGSRIHRQLVEEGYEVGITTVRDYLREKRRRQAEVFIPLVLTAPETKRRWTSSK
jgi:transposase